ncbi:single-stranded-DNA-specific exonuclease RecJ [Acinetobacter sp. MD2(2019)]|uniref:single-stranded-DNA-specific exonuclease RecJ n=1 Tax=Acinetobacter sp. MD2(2019) TaxID=2605273 RepID=UPI002D1F8AE8|nr:single-stranded-DNA-specific exonuclease RecJ [Acinetobacter sp. MD2(2019)]MEB3753110.1 single-stranded-DNA-specific exonuclease RecJ [Acinetobacter sp. MD2(2019)]
MKNIQIQTRPLLTRPENFQGMLPFMADIFARRGVESVQDLTLKLQHLLPPNLKGLEQAVELINQSIDQQHKIVIVGDYDADGATSTALMILALRDMGADVDYIVPDRFKYGYGLTPAIADLVQQTFQPHLLITVDNGISSHAGVAQAQQYGMQVIVTDHHLTTKAAPNAEAIVNPNQLGCDFESKALAGVGVAFYMLARLSSLRRQQGKSSSQLTQYLDLVALGTYADVAALDYNNRILVDAGLKRIQQQQARKGILALLEVAGREASGLKAQDLGFVLGPRLNAAGRMESMQIGIECLLAEDYSTAHQIAQQLHTLNLERRQVEAEMKQEALQALAQLELDQQSMPEALVLFEPHWHQGVIGIVAGRLKEQFHRPSIVFAPDEDGIHIKGSARSIDGIHIRDAIEYVAQQSPHLVRYFGGHAAAAGLTIEKQHFEEFKQQFIRYIQQMDRDLFQMTLWTDGELPAEAFQLTTVDLIEQAGPWGQKFPAPVFEGWFDIQEHRWLKEKHLKLNLVLDNGQRVEALAFNAQEQFEFNASCEKVRLVYELERNTFNGASRLQLRVLHLTQ